ncbi:type III secretion system inner membrane ring subunit SctD [Ewingella americana]|uniref:type III secretion system inner membrane ring subunit SctD n=1 Tax=Ewingella americana TaxID=41202 RepID=UPI0012ADD550|nr:type III secretion system inner membrane ring subunit SctD [Ewingella americana]MRT05900.1 EscD/YscD/HrpQ family type III secretion system inner membrane ring protein [Ewingella americana]
MSQYIHFLNGPLQRQCLMLPEGSLICGMSPESDIIFPLEGSIEQFILAVGDGLVELVSEAPCQVAGKKSAVSLLPHDTLVDIAGCEFVLSLSESTPDLPSTALVQLAPIAGRAVTLSPGLLGFIGMVLMVIVVSVLWLKKPDTSATSLQDIQQWSKQELAVNLRDLHLNWRSDGQVTLSGYYADQKMIQPLLQQLKHYGVPYQQMAFNEEDLRDALTDLAAQNGFEDLKISRGLNPGSVEISGAIIADNNWRQFLDGLQEIEGLNSWHVQNLTMMNTSELLKLVKQLNLLGLVSIERHKQIYTITGLLNASQRDALNKGIEDLTGGVKGRIYFQNMSPASPSDSVFPQPVTSVGGSKNKPFIELADGQRLQPGARLANNYEVVAIDAKRGIDLLGEDQLLHYTFNF